LKLIAAESTPSFEVRNERAASFAWGAGPTRPVRGWSTPSAKVYTSMHQQLTSHQRGRHAYLVLCSGLVAGDGDAACDLVVPVGSMLGAIEAESAGSGEQEDSGGSEDHGELD
jgi:hypothetical protein